MAKEENAGPERQPLPQHPGETGGQAAERVSREAIAPAAPPTLPHPASEERPQQEDLMWKLWDRCFH